MRGWLAYACVACFYRYCSFLLGGWLSTGLARFFWHGQFLFAPQDITFLPFRIRATVSYFSPRLSLAPTCVPTVLVSSPPVCSRPHRCGHVPTVMVTSPPVWSVPHRYGHVPTGVRVGFVHRGGAVVLRVGVWRPGWGCGVKGGGVASRVESPGPLVPTESPVAVAGSYSRRSLILPPAVVTRVDACSYCSGDIPTGVVSSPPVWSDPHRYGHVPTGVRVGFVHRGGAVVLRVGLWRQGWGCGVKGGAVVLRVGLWRQGLGRDIKGGVVTSRAGRGVRWGCRVPSGAVASRWCLAFRVGMSRSGWSRRVPGGAVASRVGASRPR